MLRADDARAFPADLPVRFEDPPDCLDDVPDRPVRLPDEDAPPVLAAFPERTRPDEDGGAEEDTIFLEAVACAAPVPAEERDLATDVPLEDAVVEEPVAERARAAEPDEPEDAERARAAEVPVRAARWREAEDEERLFEAT